MRNTLAVIGYCLCFLAFTPMLSFGAEPMKISPPLKHEIKMTTECGALREFFTYLDNKRMATIAEIETEARVRFPSSTIENRKGILLTIDFKTSLPCHDEITKDWGAPKGINQVSPPPIGPNQPILKYRSIEENPFYWTGMEYFVFGRTINIRSDRKRIKSLRIDSHSSTEVKS